MAKKSIPSPNEVSKLVKEVMISRRAVETLRELREIILSELKRENREYVITAKRLKSIVRNIKNITIKAKTKRSAKIMLREKCPICDEFIFDTFATNLAGKKIRLGYKCKKCGFKTTSRAIMPMKYTFIWKSKQ